MEKTNYVCLERAAQAGPSKSVQDRRTMVVPAQGFHWHEVTPWTLQCPKLNNVLLPPPPPPLWQ